MTQAHGPGIAPRRFRDVLGHFPTGVCIVTAIDQGGEPVGMTVGSFASVSLEPPLVAFFPDRGSTTFPRIREAASFCVNVLAASQESVCRTFATRGIDKFGAVGWRPAPSGAPILDGVVAWIDCVPESLAEAGDHFVFMGRVGALEIENPTLPLLFFQGGYGAFAVKSVVMGARSGLNDQILLADRVRHELERLSRDAEVEAQAFAPFEDCFVLVAAAAPTAISTPSRVGIRVPIAAPVGRIFVAWAGEEAIGEWFARSPVPLDDRRRAQLDAELGSLREHGWVPAFHSEPLDSMWSTITRIIESGQTPLLERHLREDARHIEGSNDPADVDESTAGSVQSLLAPVFGSDGRVALMFALVGIPEGLDLARITVLKDRLLDAAGAATARLDGRRP